MGNDSDGILGRGFETLLRSESKSAESLTGGATPDVGEGSASQARRNCARQCPEESGAICARSYGHAGRHEGGGIDWWDDSPPAAQAPARVLQPQPRLHETRTVTARGLTVTRYITPPPQPGFPSQGWWSCRVNRGCAAYLIGPGSPCPDCGSPSFEDSAAALRARAASNGAGVVEREIAPERAGPHSAGVGAGGSAGAGVGDVVENAGGSAAGVGEVVENAGGAASPAPGHQQDHHQQQSAHRETVAQRCSCEESQRLRRELVAAHTSFAFIARVTNDRLVDRLVALAMDAIDLELDR